MVRKHHGQFQQPSLIQVDVSLQVEVAAMGGVGAALGDPAVPADTDPRFLHCSRKKKKRWISKSSAFSLTSRFFHLPVQIPTP